MANQCDFILYVTGQEKDILEFKKRLQGDSKTDKRYYGIDFTEDFGFIGLNNSLVSLEISGACAWSVENCFLKTGYKYDDFKLNHSNSTTLEEDTKELNLVVEVFSTEAGNRFQEHYVVSFGDVEVDEVLDYAEINKDDYMKNPDAFLDIINEFGMEHEDILQSIEDNKDEEWIPLGKLERNFQDFSNRFKHEPLKNIIRDAQDKVVIDCSKSMINMNERTI